MDFLHGFDLVCMSFFYIKIPLFKVELFSVSAGVLQGITYWDIYQRVDENIC